MSERPECLLDIVDAANAIEGPVRPAMEVIQSAVISEVTDQAILSCGKCGIGLSISTELGPDHTRLMLSSPPNPEACDIAGVKYRKVGDWVANMSKRWFRVSLLDTSTESPENPVSLIMSRHGLDTVLHDAAQNTVMARQAEDRKDPRRNPLEATRLKDTVSSTVKTLDLVLVRPDSKTWQEEVDDRAALLD